MDTGPYGETRDELHPMPLSRRRFLRTSAMAVAGGVLFSCTGGTRIPNVDDTIPETDTRWPIKRVIYVMLENRSFNNLFGKFPGVRAGTTVGVDNGVEKPLIRCPEWLPGDIPHDLAAHRSSVNGGKMDGFGTGVYGSVYGYTIFDEDQIPNYWHWAREYGLSDSFFASAAGPSYPNHFYFIAGSSGGVADNPENIRTRPMEDGKLFKSWGCDAEGDQVFVLVTDEAGNVTKHNTCFEFPTVGEQLTQAGVDWAYYSAVPGQPGYFWNAYNGVSNVFHTDLWPEHIAVGRHAPRRHRRERPPARHLGDPTVPALRPSAVLHGPRAQLGHEDREQGDALRHVGAHGDLPDVGRVGWLLRSRRSALRRSPRPGHPRPVAHDLAVHAPGRDR